MMLQPTSTLLLVALTIMLAATLTKHKIFDNNTESSVERQRILIPFDLSCWVIGKPDGCNTPAITPAPSKAPTVNPPPPPTPRPTTSSQTPPSAPSPLPPTDNYFWMVIQIDGWTGGGYCSNSVKSVAGVPVYGTREECCVEFAGSSAGEKYDLCIDFDPVPNDFCDGMNKDSCKNNAICEYNQFKQTCRMRCEGSDGNQCKQKVECQWVPLKSFCTMTEDQYQLAQCARLSSNTGCADKRGCIWDYYASNKQGECQSKCGRERKSNTCEEAGDDCYWDPKKKKCYFDVSMIDAPTPMPVLPRFCPNIRKQEECNANKPRCKWNNNSKKCDYICEDISKKPNCKQKTKYCLWDNKEGKCWPKYEDYCEDLGAAACENTLQCEWNKGCVSRCTSTKQQKCDNNDNEPCFWDPEVNVCRYDQDLDTQKKLLRPLRDRFKKGRLFDR